MDNIKFCGKCNKSLPTFKFGKNKRSKDGLSLYCKECKRIQAVQYRKDNAEEISSRRRKNYTENKEKFAKQRKQYKDKNPNKVAEAKKRSYEKNKEYCLNYYKEYREKNKEVLKGKALIYREENKDSIYKRNAKRRSDKLLANPVSNNKSNPWNNSDWVELNELIISEIYSKSKELTNITGIMHHVDHIIPLKSEVVCGLHVYNNLQILTATDNCAKGNKFDLSP